jgi:hypothetical protein
MSDHSQRKSVNSRRSFIVGVSDALVAAAPTTGLPTIHGRPAPTSCGQDRPTSTCTLWGVPDARRAAMKPTLGKTITRNRC